MNVFLMGIRIKDEAIVEDDKVNVIAESLPSSNKRVSTKIQLVQKADHYVGKLLKNLKEKQEVLAIGPTKATPDGVLQMQPMLVVSTENFSDILAINPESVWRDLTENFISRKFSSDVNHGQREKLTVPIAAALTCPLSGSDAFLGADFVPLGR